MIAKQLQEIVGRAAGVAPDQVHLEHPDPPAGGGDHGDYSTNIALVLKGGRKLADEIAGKIKANFINNVDVAGPGFINIELNHNYLIQALETAGELPKKSGKKIMLEYGQPNTHKLPHIGHLFSYIYGESLSRILEADGNEVYRANYQGDVGLHVAKCLWSFKKNNPQVPDELADKVALLQKMYQEGSRAYEADEPSKQEIMELNKKIYAQDPEIVDLWSQTRGWSVEYYKQFEKRIGATYDKHYFESEVAEIGKQTVLDNVGSVFVESQGAVVFEGPHTRVFVTSEGNPTYEAKDLALELRKMQDWPADKLIITTASEQNEYFKVVFAALERLDPSLAGKLEHIGFGMINLKSGKMGSRTGNIIGGIELVDAVVSEVAKLGEASVAEQVGLGAVKYAFLKKAPTQDMVFDIESSIATEGNSGPYIQYTYARAQSVLRKSTPSSEIKDYKPNTEELALLRWIYRYPEAVAESAGRYAPNLLTNYLFELAHRFNTFYNKHTIVGSDNRIKLTQAVGKTLNAGLNLLGIEALERM
jgi:arginyl-tRNA synthetase